MRSFPERAYILAFFAPFLSSAPPPTKNPGSASDKLCTRYEKDSVGKFVTCRLVVDFDFDFDTGMSWSRLVLSATINIFEAERKVLKDLRR